MNEILVDPGMDFNNYRNKMKQLPKKKKNPTYDVEIHTAKQLNGEQEWKQDKLLIFPL